MKIYKIKKEILVTFIVIIVSGIFNWILVSPIKSKIEKLEKNNKIEKIVSQENNDKENNKDVQTDDIVLKIENDFSKFIDILYINKFTEWDENNDEYTKIELKVSGTVDQLFKVNDEIEKIKGKNIIENIQINKKSNNNVEMKEEIKVDIIDCTMTLNVK